MKYEETLNYILDIPKFGKKNNLNDRKELLSRLGDQYKKLKYIHVAGTNGKGSVCAYISSVLREAGHKIGLFTSPHLVKINERFQINGEPISDELLYDAYRIVREKSEGMVSEGKEHPSFFEFIFAMALYIFEHEKVDYVVLETGLGGRLDATNTVENPLLTIITTIGYDHIDVLGSTIEEITYEKAGIIKPNCPVVYYYRDEKVFNVINKIATEKNSKQFPISEIKYENIKINNKSIDFYINTRYYEYRINMPFIAKYQIINLGIALTALEVLKGMITNITNEVIIKGISNTKWAGRMEYIEDRVIVDGAHNEDGITAFIETIKEFYSDKKINILFGCVKDKDYHKMIKKLCSELLIENITITEPDTYRLAPVEELMPVFQSHYTGNICAIKNIQQAYNKAKELTKEDELLFCVGSLYLVGNIKQIVRED